MEKALLGRALDVDALIQALEALPQDLHPTSTPGSLPWPTCITLSVRHKKHISELICVQLVDYVLFALL